MNFLREFLNERSGNFGILTALIIVPVLGCIGVAIDFNRALTMRSDLMGMADAAALAAISESSIGTTKIKTMSGDGEVPVAEEDGKTFFLSQIGASSISLRGIGLDVSVKVAKRGDEVSSTVSFSAEVPTTFMRILGWKTIDISGTAVAASGSQSRVFSDFYMLLDNSPSMGIGATKSDMDKLAAATTALNVHAGCVFACHTGSVDNSGTFREDTQSTYKIARANNVTLRIDVVADAARALVNKIKSDATNSDGHYKVAVYTFGKYALEPGYRIDRLASLTLNMPSVNKALNDVGLMTTNHNGFNKDALTSFDTALTLIGQEISGHGGTGASAADRQKVVYFVTDGMQDMRKVGGSCAGSWTEPDEKDRCIEPIDLKYCDTLKQRNIKIAVLYTTYLPVTGDHLWETHIKKQFAGKIAERLQACASENLFFEVAPGDDMKAAMAQLFVKSSSNTTGLRLAK